MGIEIIGYVKIHWNLKKPIKLSDRSIEMNELNENDSSYSSFKATSVRDLKKKRQQISFDDTFSKVSAKVSENFFRNQTVKVKSMSKSSKRSSILQDDLEEEENATRDEMFLPSYGSASNICVDNKTTCWKAIKILLEKFHIESSPDGYSLYKVYQSGEIRELNSGDFPLIQRLYMGPFNEDKIFIMEKGRTVSVDQDVMNLVTLPKALLKALIESSKKEESKEISEFKQKYKTYRDILNYRLKSLK